jgi:hypothetical protein
VELIDIKLNSYSKLDIGSVLFNFVENYFDKEKKQGNHIHPIYLQHDGYKIRINIIIKN